MAFDAAMFNTLKDIRKEQVEKLDLLIGEQRRTNQLLEQLVQTMQAGMTINETRAMQGLEPRQWYPPPQGAPVPR